MLRAAGMHYLLFLAISLVWGSSFILMKKAALSYGAISIGALRLLGGLAILVVIMRFAGAAWRPRGRDWPLLLVVVLTGYAWPYCLQPFLVGAHGSGYIGMLVAFVPLLTILAQLPLLRLRPSVREVAGVSGGLLCLWLVMEDGQERNVGWLHLALAVTVPAGYAVANTLVKRHFAAVPTLALTAWCLAIASAMVAPVALVVDPVPKGDHLLLATAAVGILGVVGTGLAIAGLYHLIQQRGPLWAGMVTYLIPLGAIAWAWADGERITLLQLIALAGVLAMVALVQTTRASPVAPGLAAGEPP